MACRRKPFANISGISCARRSLGRNLVVSNNLPLASRIPPRLPFRTARLENARILDVVESDMNEISINIVNAICDAMNIGAARSLLDEVIKYRCRSFYHLLSHSFDAVSFN